MKYDVEFIRLSTNTVADVWTFNTLHEAEYFAITEQQWEWYDGDGHCYVLNIRPHAREEVKVFEGKEYLTVTDGVDTLVNLCPHDMTFVVDGNYTVTVPASGRLARATVKTVRDGEFMGIPMSQSVLGEVTGLPDRYAHVGWLVSRVVKDMTPFRPDLFIPNETVRDDKGQVAGATSLG